MQNDRSTHSFEAAGKLEAIAASDKGGKESRASFIACIDIPTGASVSPKGREPDQETVIRFFYQFLSPFITVHPRRNKTKDDVESLEQYAPKHPASFSTGMNGDERG